MIREVYEMTCDECGQIAYSRSRFGLDLPGWEVAPRGYVWSPVKGTHVPAPKPRDFCAVCVRTRLRAAS